MADLSAGAGALAAALGSSNNARNAVELQSPGSNANMAGAASRQTWANQIQENASLAQARQQNPNASVNQIMGIGANDASKGPDPLAAIALKQQQFQQQKMQNDVINGHIQNAIKTNQAVGQIMATNAPWGEQRRQIAAIAKNDPAELSILPPATANPAMVQTFKDATENFRESLAQHQAYVVGGMNAQAALATTANQRNSAVLGASTGYINQAANAQLAYKAGSEGLAEYDKNPNTASEIVTNAFVSEISGGKYKTMGKVPRSSAVYTQIQGVVGRFFNFVEGKSLPKSTLEAMTRYMQEQATASASVAGRTTNVANHIMHGQSNSSDIQGNLNPDHPAGHTVAQSMIHEKVAAALSKKKQVAGNTSVNTPAAMEDLAAQEGSIQ